MAKKDFLLEESALDNLADGLDMVERPISGRIFAFFAWAIIIIFAVFFFRVTVFNFFNSSLYQSRALSNAGQRTILKAPRGIIYDRFGSPLMTNDPSFDLVVNLSELFKDRENIGNSLSEVSKIIEFDADLVKQEIMASDLEHQSDYIISKNLSVSQALGIKNLNLKAFLIQNNYSRKYFDPEAFSHVTGYVGLVSRKDLDKNKDFLINDDIGKSGLEFFYDNYLRGDNGYEVSYKDAQGNIIEKKFEKNSVSGNNLYTSIDGDLQKFFYKSLSSQLSSLGRNSGVGLALNPQTGEVLSLISVPGFNTNNLTSDLFIDKSRPTFNRVVSGVYSPGSTIKPLVAFAALEEGVVDALKSVFSAGFIEIPNPYFPDKPSRFVDWKAHGWVNMYSALARSSNVYFYSVGGGFDDITGLGVDRLKKYWQKFYLDKKTGIDLPGEDFGFLPDPKDKERKTGQIWRIGDTYNVSIGQGDLMITPLELLRYISSIANKGKLPVPFIVKNIKNSKNEIIYEKIPSFDEVEYKNINNFEEVELGMLDGVKKDYGTAHMLSSVPMTIAGKTGSAQIQNNQKTNAFVVAYTKDLKENIAILVLIEDAREGSMNAVPVAKEVLEWYYNNRVKEK